MVFMPSHGQRRCTQVRLLRKRPSTARASMRRNSRHNRWKFKAGNMLAEHKAVPFAAALPRVHDLEAPNTSVTGPAIECLTASMRPEARLILLCARRQTNAETAEQIKTLLRLELDWEYIVDQAHQHCVTPLVYQALGTVCRLGVPKDVFAR